MTIVGQIKMDLYMHRMHGPAREQIEILSTLLAEIQKVGKDKGNRESTDTESIYVIKKFISGIDEMIIVLTKNGKNDIVKKLKDEKLVYEAYLPKQFFKEELEKILHGFIFDDKHNVKNIGIVMKMLKENYTGLYDGGMASEIAKTMLQEKNIS